MSSLESHHLDSGLDDNSDPGGLIRPELSPPETMARDCPLREAECPLHENAQRWR
jgi:hypothetical protein